MKRYIKRQYPLLIATFLMCVAYSVVNVGIAVLLQRIVDTASSKNMDRFIKLIFIASIYISVLAIVYYVYNRTINKLSKNIIEDLRNELFSGILHRNYEQFMRNDSATYISSLVNDVNLLESMYVGPLIRIVQNSVMFVLTVILLLNYGDVIIIWLTFLLILMMVLPRKLGKSMQGRQSKLSNQMKCFTQVIRDYLSGYEVIRAANIENTIISKYKNENMLVTLRKYDRDNIISLSDSISCLLSSFMQVSIIFIGVFSIIRGNMTIGTLTALIQLCNMFTTPVSAIMQDLSEMKSAEPIVKKIEAYICHNGETQNCHLGSINRVRLEDMCFRYPSKQENTLEIKELEFQRGKKYLVTGKSGCGKSTLLGLLAGYFQEYEGHIFLNETELRDISANDIYQKIAVIHQNVFLFNDTILENILLGQKHSDEDLERVLKMSGIDLFIDTIPRGLNARVGENGRELSGGQRQRIAIARALIQKKELLLLDESISSIDKQTGNDIENRILNISDVAVINVSHDLKEASLSRYDEILFIQEGKITEMGSYGTLRSKNGEFQKYLLSCGNYKEASHGDNS
ncbi:MAG TPA: ABC transporter ATP-binding protein [Candidatus Merdenecus merdavium]|nr:ABC transporter ATP-binding protein [Candidatus Merdenecus merdavium]